MTPASDDHHKVPIRIEGQTYPVRAETLTGAEIRAIPDPPIGDDRDLYLDVDGPIDELVGDDEKITLEPQMTFFSVVKKINPGQLTLPQSVLADVEADGGVWEFTQVGRLIHAVRRQLVLPPGLAPETVDLLVKLPAGFPTSGPDMFWVSPAITIVGRGAPQGCGSPHTWAGVTWQRWSRHIGAGWRPGVDGLGTYLGYIRRCLAIEAERSTGERAA